MAATRRADRARRAAARDRAPHARPLPRPAAAGGCFRQMLSDAARLRERRRPALLQNALAVGRARGGATPVRPERGVDPTRFGMSSAMYARTMPSKSASARMPSAGPELRREIRRPRRHDPVDHRIVVPLDACGDGVAGDAAQRVDHLADADVDAGHVDRSRVRERARRRFVADDQVVDDRARRLHPHPRRRRDRDTARRRPTAARG